ncbi:MAG TPA: 3-deoxy-7-phosphoheptulonate synthase [Solirubrobacterales bacterium]|nr:3-deoxy-7-phosphoheptulonate synthase [Solirubrobacterales bacterium]
MEKGEDKMIIGMQEGAKRDGVRDQRIAKVVELSPPETLLEELPLGEERAQKVVRAREEVAAVLGGGDPRLMVVVGPCSVHDPKAALEYARRLGGLAKELGDRLLIVMRVYFEKPRTTTGWKGLINDPHLDNSGDVNAGLRIARKLLLEVVDLGLPVGCEFLDPITPQYIADTVAWGAIGARTSESQTHRQLASGLSMPIGFKNRTDGNVQIAVDAVRAAAAPHAFAGIDDAGMPAILHTTGNPDCHIILRGGHGMPNYHVPEVEDALVTLGVAGLTERLVIDASHDNSGKDPEKQFFAAGEIADQVADGNKAIVGVMMESFLVEGRQDLKAGESLVYGQSITDACIDWPDTVSALERFASAVEARRDS